MTDFYSPRRDPARHLTTGDVADLLGLSRRTVCKLMDRGDLPGYRLFGSSDRRFRPCEVRKWAKDYGILDTAPVVLALGLADDSFRRLADLVDGAADLIPAVDAFAAGAIIVDRDPSVAVVDTGVAGATASTTVSRLTARVPVVLAFGASPLAQGSTDAPGVSWLGHRPDIDRIAVRAIAAVLARPRREMPRRTMPVSAG